MAVRGETRRRFERNLARVAGLLKLHKAATEKAVGRPAQHASDLLRAATVLLHGTMEDLLRSLAEQYWPSASPDVLAEVPLKGLTKLAHTVRDLAPYRHLQVNALIEESIHAHLQRETFNSLGEVEHLLQSIGTDMTKVRGNFNDLKELISRRHHIVHQADRGSGVGVNSTKPIARPKVETWLRAVGDIGRSAIQALP
jgi:hypothetical protein